MDGFEKHLSFGFDLEHLFIYLIDTKIFFLLCFLQPNVIFLVQLVLEDKGEMLIKTGHWGLPERQTRTSLYNTFEAKK